MKMKIDTNGVLITAITASITVPSNLRWHVISAINAGDLASAWSNGDWVEVSINTTIDTNTDGWIRDTHDKCRQVLCIMDNAQYHVQRVLDSIAEIEEMYCEENENDR